MFYYNMAYSTHGGLLVFFQPAIECLKHKLTVQTFLALVGANIKPQCIDSKPG